MKCFVQKLHSYATSLAWKMKKKSTVVCRHAGVYTAEEVALIMRDKLIRLQSLYIDQFKRLQHVMKEKRRKYLHTVDTEREMLGKSFIKYGSFIVVRSFWLKITCSSGYPSGHLCINNYIMASDVFLAHLFQRKGWAIVIARSSLSLLLCKNFNVAH